MTNNDELALKAAAEKYRVTYAAHRANPRDYEALAAWDKASFEFSEITNNNELDIIAGLLAERDDDKKRIAELEAELSALRPVGVMSKAAFHRLEDSESRFIALWPRPGIPLPRKRPDDGVLVYAKVGG